MIDVFISRGPSLHLLQLRLGRQALQSEEQGLEEAEVLGPLECLGE